MNEENESQTPEEDTEGNQAEASTENSPEESTAEQDSAEETAPAPEAKSDAGKSEAKPEANEDTLLMVLPMVKTPNQMRRKHQSRKRKLLKIFSKVSWLKSKSVVPRVVKTSPMVSLM